MNSSIENNTTKLSDYLSILLKWKNFILFNFLFFLTINVVIVLLLANQYKATTVVMIPQQNNMGLGGLAGLVSGSSPVSVGAKLFGLGGNTSEDMLLGILNSRQTLTYVIDKFDLFKYYDIKNQNYDKLLKVFRSDLSFDPNEFGMIEISVINKNPKVAAIMANYFVYLLDSLNIHFTTEQAKNNKKFIESRYLKNIEDLRNAEDSMYLFQKKYGIYVIPEQIELAVKVAAELESKIAELEINKFTVMQTKGINSPEYSLVQNQISMINKKVSELKNANSLSDTSNILFPFKKAPEIIMKYFKYYREIQIQTKILEVVLPLYEQAKIEEQKSIPTVQVLDFAVPPIEKYSPKRSFIVAGFSGLFLFFLILIVFIGERHANDILLKNLVDKRLNSFFNKIKRFYRVK